MPTEWLGEESGDSLAEERGGGAGDSDSREGREGGGD